MYLLTDLTCGNAHTFFGFFYFRNEALRVAFIHVEESGPTDGKVTKEFYSKLVKADAHGKDQVLDLETHVQSCPIVDVSGISNIFRVDSEIRTVFSVSCLDISV